MLVEVPNPETENPHNTIYPILVFPGNGMKSTDNVKGSTMVGVHADTHIPNPMTKLKGTPKKCPVKSNASDE